MAERVQTRDLASPERIRPSASPVDTYYRPAEDQVAKPGTQAQWAKDLAEGLDVLNPSIERYGEAKFKRESAAEMAAGAEARDRNMASFKEAIQKKLIPEGASPWFKKGYEQQSGRLAGSELYDAGLRTAWSQSGIQNNDSPQAYQKFVADYRKQFLDEHQGAVSNPDWYEGFAPMMARAENNLAGQHIAHRQHEIAKNVRENLSRESATMIDSFRGSQLSSLTGLAEANASVDDIRNAKLSGISNLGANLSAMTADLVKKGLSGSDANKIVTDSIIVKARDSRDADVLMLLDHVQTGAGTLAGTQYAKEQRLATETYIRDFAWKEQMQSEHNQDRPYTLEQQNHAREQWGWSKEAHDRSIKEQNRHEETRALQGLLNSGVTMNSAKPIDPNQIARLEKLSPGSGQAVLAYQNFMLTNQERIVTNNQAYISILSAMQKDPENFNVQRIWDGVTGKMYDAGTANRLFDEYKSLQSEGLKEPLLKDQVFLTYRAKLEAAVAGNPAQITGAKISDSGTAGVLFFRQVREFKNTKKPSEAELNDFMDQRYEALFGKYASDVADQTVVAQDKAALEAQKVAEQKKQTTQKQLIDRYKPSELSEMNAPTYVLRAWEEAVRNDDADAKAAILKKYPKFLPPSEKAKR